MTKETLFKQIDEIFGDWHGGVCYIGKERENQVKEILEKAINYNRCCTTLKDKEALSFDGFKDEFYYKAQMGIYESKATGMFYNLTDLEKRYKKYCERF